MLRFNEEIEELQLVKTESHVEHEKKITDLACHNEKNLLISGSIDGLVKIWNIKKDLIREIKFPEEVFTVSFLNNDGDIIVGHKGKVSIVYCKDYRPAEIMKVFKPPAEDLEKFFAQESV